MANLVDNVVRDVQFMQERKQLQDGVVSMSDDTHEDAMRVSFFDMRRVMQLTRQLTAKAPWFTIRHMEVLLVVFDHMSERGLEQQLVHKITDLNQSTTQRILQKFVDLGWLNIETDPTDRRIRLISLTTTPKSEETFSGIAVRDMLLDAGTKRDSGAALQRNFEKQLLGTANVNVHLEPQDIVMKAEVGKVTVKTFDAKMSVKRAEEVRRSRNSLITRSRFQYERWSYFKVVEEELAGKIQKVMERDDGRWSIYKKDSDVYGDEPIAIQLDMPKEDESDERKGFNSLVDGVFKTIVNIMNHGDGESGPTDVPEEPVNKVLGVLVRKLNREEYKNLRHQIMIRLSKRADEMRERANKAFIEGQAQKAKAERLMEERDKTPFTHQENFFHGLSMEELKKHAQSEAIRDDAEAQAALHSAMVALIMRGEGTDDA